MKYTIFVFLFLLSFIVQAQGSSDSSTSLSPVFIAVIANILLTLATLLFTSFQNSKSYRIEAKKILVTERMKAHKELYNILTNGMTTKTLITTNQKTYSVFQSIEMYNEWSYKVWSFVDSNSVYLSEDVLRAYVELYSKREYFMLNAHDDLTLQKMALEEFIELTLIFENFFKAIGKFFEKDMHKDYSFTNILRLQEQKINRR